MTNAEPVLLSASVASFAENAIASLVETEYRFAENIDAANGVFDCDCSGFVGYVLQALAPRHYALIPKEADHLRPRAFEYYRFIDGLTAAMANMWQPVGTFADVRRGDVVAWELGGTPQPGHDTGHVFYAAETPQPIDATTLALRVYDSTNLPHFEDSRGPGRPFASGVGAGVIKFQIDVTGKAVAFEFVPGAETIAMPIAVGRPV